MLLFEWMARAVVLAVLVGAAAWALEDLLRGARRSARFVWMSALVVSAALPFLSLAAPDLWPESWKRERTVVAAADFALPEATVAPSAPATLPATPSTWSTRGVVLGLWLCTALFLLLRWLHGWNRLRSLRPRWGEALVAGERVLVADDFGPAVVGLARPRVVIPAWLLACDADQQRMTVRHELEHIRAGDAWPLALAPLLLVLFPWNPALWWQVQRLRTAVELDCDARVLRGGVSALAYGTMLLDVAGGVRVPHSTLAALTEPRRSLERRIRAMSQVRYRQAVLRLFSLAAFAALTLAAAFLAAAPTATRVVAQERPAPPAQQQQQEARPLIVVDGKVLPPNSKLDLTHLSIGTIAVVSPSDAVLKFGERGRLGAVVITTRDTDTRADTARSSAAGTIEQLRKAAVPAHTADKLKVARSEIEKLSTELKMAAEFEEERGPFATVAGQVIIATTGQPAVDADVQIGSRHTVTDAFGRYVIRNVPVGDRFIDVRMPGFIGRQPITVAGDQTLNAPTMSVRPMTDMERSKFDKSPPHKRMEWELEQVNLVKRTGLAASTPLIILDDAVLGNGEDAWRAVRHLSPASIDHIEVIKGAAAAQQFGEKATDGVIIITTKKF